MNLRTGLIMAILLAAGGSYIYKTEFIDPPKESSPDEKAIFSGIEAKDVQKFALTNSKGSLRIEREGFTETTKRGATAFRPSKNPDQQWVLSIPPGAPTDAAAVSRLLGAVTALKSPMSIEEGEVGDLANYGLSAPEVSLEVEGSFGKRRISYGKKMQITGRRYLSLEGDKRVYLVDEALYSILTQPFERLRETRPIKFDRNTIQSIAVRRSTGDTVEFKKDVETRDDKIWRAVIGERSTIVDSMEFEQSLAELGSMTVARFVDEPEGPIAIYGLKEPRAVVTVHFAPGPDNKPQDDLVFYLGEGVSIKRKDEEPAEEESEESALGVSAKNAVFAKLVGDPTIYEMKSVPVSYLTRALLDYRNKEPLQRIKPEEVASITVKGKTTEGFTLLRKDERWALQEGTSDVTTEQERVAAWFANLSAARVLSYQETSPMKRDSGEYIEIHLLDGKKMRLTFGEEVGAAAAKKEAKEGERPRWVYLDMGDPESNSYAVLPAQKIADLLRDRNYFKAQTPVVESGQ